MREVGTVLLRLAGPLQSWGIQSRFTVRDTAREPSRSGVTGLLAAALGWSREAPLDRFASMGMVVRVDREGRLARDYHTAGASHPGRDAGFGVVTADGKAREPVVSIRYYLEDADFLVGLDSDDLVWLHQLDAALARPHWPLSLGRRAFTPGTPVRVGVVPGAAEAVLRTRSWLARSIREREEMTRRCGGENPPRLRLVREVSATEAADIRWDVPLSFADGARRFMTRGVMIDYVTLAPEMIADDPLCISRG